MGNCLLLLFSGHSYSRGKYLTQHYGTKGWVLRACLSMMTILMHPGRLLKLTMPAAAAVEEDHPNSKKWNTSHKRMKELLFHRTSGFSLQLVMHARGMCHEDDKETSKENGWGSQPDILKYLEKYSFEVKAATRLPNSKTWESWDCQFLPTPRHEYSWN